MNKKFKGNGLGLRIIDNIMYVVVALVSVIAAYYIQKNNFLLFHSLIEIVSIVIFWSIYLIIWNSRKHLDNYFYLLLGTAALYVGVLDLFHTLSYKGMNILSIADANISTQLWVSSRFIFALTMLVAPFLIKKKNHEYIISASYLLLTAIIFLSIFKWQNFPTCFIEEKGLTNFKIITEYLIIFLFALSAGFLFLKKKYFSHNTYILLNMVILFSIISEILFTKYIHVTDSYSALGHIFKALSVFCLYRAMVHVGVKNPQDLIFKGILDEKNKISTERDTFKKREDYLSGNINSLEGSLRKQEQLIQKNSIQIESLLSYSPVALILTDEKGIIKEFKGDEHILQGFSDDVKVGESFFSLTKNSNVDKEAVSLPEPEADETTLVLRNNNNQYFHITIRPFYENKSFRNLICVITDITQQKISALELVKKNRVFNSIYNAITSIENSESGIYDKITHDIAKLMGFSYVEINQKEDLWFHVLSNYYDGVSSKGHKKIFDKDILTFFEDKESNQDEDYLENPFSLLEEFSENNFKYFYVFKIYYKGFPPEGLLIVGNKNKKLLNDEDIKLLEIYATFLAFQIMQNKIQEKDRKNAHDKLVSNIASGVAHEVRNPLNAILISFEVMEDIIKEGGDYTIYLTRIKRQIGKIIKLMSDLLLLRKHTNKKLISRYDLYELFNGIIKEWQISTKNNIVIKKNFSKEIEGKKISVDKENIYQVFVNLLDNAVQNIEGDGIIEINFSLVENDKYCKIELTDNGKGIPEYELSQIFDPFYTTRKSGSGLGLSIVKRIIENHEGRFRIFNNINIPGCTAEILLPINGDISEA